MKLLNSGSCTSSNDDIVQICYRDNQLQLAQVMDFKIECA